jgi:hypothetical protein
MRMFISCDSLWSIGQTSWFLDQFATDATAPWTSDQLVARSVVTQHRETKDKHPYPKRDSNPRSSLRALQSRASNRAAAGSTDHFSAYT